VSPGPFSIRFLPDDVVWQAESPVELYLAAAGAGILVEQPCGSAGVCGRCRVRVVEGGPAPTELDRRRFSESELAAGWRLGCRLVLDGPAVVEIPAVTRSLAGKSFGGDLSLDRVRPVVTWGRVPVVSFSGPSGPLSVLDALAVAAGLPERSLAAGAETLGALAAVRDSPSGVGAVIHGREVVRLLTGDVSRLYGLAIDIGTTSLAAALVSLSDGAVAASASALNPQVTFGADVISRIAHAIDVPDGTSHLARAVRRGLAVLVDELRGAAGCAADDLVLASVAGNPTMLHAWLAVPPVSLGRAPYAGVWSDAIVVKAASVNLPILQAANVLVFPLVRSHVGGDAVAAAVACGLDRTSGSRLLIDVGTNTEVLLAHGGRLLATSAAAGPAFEGVSIRHGMRGAPGAIDAVWVAEDGRVAVSTIGHARAVGICGSGLIDAVAELVRTGVIADSGSLRRAEEYSGPAALAARLRPVDGQQAFTLFARSEGAGADEGDVVLTARDIREVQLAKASIVAATTLLCRHVGIETKDLDEVLVAGAFGNHIRKASARRLGLLPPIDPERIHLVGNAAGVGARMALLDAEVVERAQGMAARAEYLDLATHPAYQAAFMDALMF
jgi:uncharacterized 2Fe-2S/4Fe-4S cluster protein (DUF4445 family)